MSRLFLKILKIIKCQLFHMLFLLSSWSEVIMAYFDTFCHVKMNWLAGDIFLSFYQLELKIGQADLWKYFLLTRFFSSNFRQFQAVPVHSGWIVGKLIRVYQIPCAYARDFFHCQKLLGKGAFFGLGKKMGGFRWVCQVSVGGAWGRFCKN